MAGYFIYTFDYGLFSQLTTTPTKEQCDLLADYLIEEMDEYIEDLEEADASLWPTDRDALSKFIMKRLGMQDWYSDLSSDNAEIWDGMLLALQDDQGKTIGLDLQGPDFECIYWDCAEIAVQQGASMMAESVIGSSRFRYFGKPADDYNLPLYSIFTPDQCKELLAQLEKVEPYFASLAKGEESPREQFFEGLLPQVQSAVNNTRGLWVQTDT